MKPGDIAYIKDNGYTHTTYKSIFVTNNIDGYVEGFKHENGSIVEIIKLALTESTYERREGAFVRNELGTTFIGLPGLERVTSEEDTFTYFKNILGDDTDEEMD